MAQVSLCMSFHVIHACALVSGCLSGLSSPVSLLLPPVLLPALLDVHPGARFEISIEDPLCDSSLGSMVSLDYVNPFTGFEPKDMELTDADELNLATTSDILFQNAWTIQLPSPTSLMSTTMSLQIFLQLWSTEQGNLLR